MTMIGEQVKKVAQMDAVADVNGGDGYNRPRFQRRRLAGSKALMVFAE